jgi:hypothetical protein
VTDPNTPRFCGVTVAFVHAAGLSLTVSGCSNEDFPAEEGPAFLKLIGRAGAEADLPVFCRSAKAGRLGATLTVAKSTISAHKGSESADAVF